MHQAIIIKISKFRLKIILLQVMIGNEMSLVVRVHKKEDIIRCAFSNASHILETYVKL